MSGTGNTNGSSPFPGAGVPRGLGPQKPGDVNLWVAAATIAYLLTWFGAVRHLPSGVMPPTVVELTFVIWSLLRAGRWVLRRLCPMVNRDCGDDEPPTAGSGGSGGGGRRTEAPRVIPLGRVAATDLGALRVADGPGDAEETEVTGGTAVAGGGEKSPLPPPTMWPSWTSVRREIDRQRARPEGECVRVPRFFADGGERRWGFVFPGVRGVLRRI